MTACNDIRQDDSDNIPPELVLQDHNLANKIFAVKTNQIIDQTRLLNAVSEAEYILIGETHDNIQHHQIQAAIIDYLSESNSTASVAFEMIDTEQGRMLENNIVTSPDYLIALLNHFQSGWEYEIYYRNLFDSVIRAGYSINSANIERNHLIEMMDADTNELPADLANILSRNSLTPQITADMELDIIDSHCGMLNKEQAQPMLRGQRIRDAAMAMSLLNSNAALKVLIAGNGHVRNDWGVARYLDQGDKGVISIGLLEVDTDHNTPADYFSHWRNAELPFDYIWFTARADRSDPCIKYKASHKRG
ncbi:MAG: hypothetical protein HW386_1309 [Gammaproteobacteria bacterium]|nr:hypothetical protein [Gammaproteobacteria bacterium]